MKNDFTDRAEEALLPPLGPKWGEDYQRRHPEDEIARALRGNNTGEPRGILNVEGVNAAPVGTQAGMLQHAFVFYSLTPGRCGYGPNRAELCGATRSAHSPLAERRQRLLDDSTHTITEIELIERATRVRMTDEIIEAARAPVMFDNAEVRARVVLEAAGFEVIE